MKGITGWTILGIGILHTGLGIVKGRSQFAEMISEGWVNSIGRVEQSYAFWFSFTGIVLVMLGYLARWAESNGSGLPKAFGWILLGSTLFGILTLPVSGFWALLLPSGLILLRKSPETPIE